MNSKVLKPFLSNLNIDSKKLILLIIFTSKKAYNNEKPFYHRFKIW